MKFIEVKTPEFVLDVIKQAEQKIQEHEDSEFMRHRTDDIVWHTSLNPNRMGAMYLLGYNDYNEFFELSIFAEDSFEVRLYNEFDNAWQIVYSESEEED